MKNLIDYINDSVNETIYTPYVYEDNKLHRLNEANLHQLLDKHSKNGYIIISPCRNGDDFGLDHTNPKDLKKLQEINNKRVKEFISVLKKTDWSYMPVYGGFIENKDKENETVVYEKSFMIFNYDKKGNIGNLKTLFDFGVEMSQKFNQDSFLYYEPNKKPAYYTKTGELEFEVGDKTKFNDFAEEYFTDLHKNTQNYKGDAAKATRFTFTECYVNPKPYCVNERLMRDKAGEIFLGKNFKEC